MRAFGVILVLVGLVFCGCRPATSAKSLAVTYVAETQVFVAAVEGGIATGIAATLTSAPTNTATATATATVRPTNTPTATATATLSPTSTLTPTTTSTPEPTATNTPSAADLKAGQLLGALRNMRTLAERLFSGLGGTGTGRVACSRELSDSVAVALEAVRNLPTFDDTLLSQRMIGANNNYRAARDSILESAEIEIVYTRCVNWLAAGKPAEESAHMFEDVDTVAAQREASQALKLAEAGLNN